MPVVLPLISYLLLVRVMAYRAGLRSAAIFAAIWWGCVLDVLKEGLGAFHLLTRFGTSVAWLLTALAVLAWDVTRRNGPPRGATRPPPAPAVSLSPGDRALLGATGVLVALVGLTAVVCPPNTWDVIDYHLPRVAMWMSNRSVSFFPTLDYAQLINSPWSEYAMLHLDLLMGNDRLVNLVEFASLIASITVASLIARELGAEGAGQVFAVVACATIPAVVLEASGAMNTLVASLWIAAAVYCVMVFGRDANWGTYLAAAVACGLAILTKGTAYVLLPALIAAGWWSGERTARRRFIVGLPVFILIIASLNAPLWYRNVQLTGSPLGSGEGLLEGGQGTALATGRLSLRGTITNVVRNLALHATITSGVDDYAGRLASRLIVALGDDPNDRDLIWQTPPEVPGESFHTNPPSRHEIFVGYPLHLLLIAIACVLTLVAAGRGVSNRLIFALGMLGSFLLFCALLRWQIWGARYQLPLFVLGSALAGSLLPAYAGRRTTAVIGWLLLIAALPYAFSNDLRPLLFAHLSPSRWMREPYGRKYLGQDAGGALLCRSASGPGGLVQRGHQCGAAQRMPRRRAGRFPRTL